MPSLNSVIEMGRLTADPELRKTINDTSVVSFSIAVDKPYNKDHQHPEANFFDCVAWKTTAENITKFFSKGSRIIIEGSLQSRTYEDKEGKKHKTVEILVNSFHFVDKKSDVDINVGKSPEKQVAENTAQDNSELEDDDLPF